MQPPVLAQEVQAHIAREPPPLLFHYTDQRGLLGVISTGEIWATSINNLNDAQEFEHAKRIAIELLRARFEAESDPFTQLHISYLKNAAEDAGINICVASWSSISDDLSQWRAYSRGGTGYSVDVAGALLRSLTVGKDFILAACVYDESEQHRLMRSLIDSNLARNLANDSVANQHERYMLESNGGNFGYELSRYAALFKHPSFASEQEWRLISEPMSVNRMDFRPGVSTIVSYHRFPLKDTGRNSEERERGDWLTSVHVGPCPEPKLATRKVEFLLAKHCDRGERPKVYASAVPYRTW